MAPEKGKLTENEKSLILNLQTKCIDEIKRLLNEKDVRVNCLDEHGMTPLQHAAYKGDIEMCKLLLDHGADVNSNEHQYNYTALMFAGLSGSVPVTSLLLAAGANVSAINSVGRTASQMAAFVGNHQCVSVMMTFISRDEIDYYTSPHGLEKEPKLPAHLANRLHRFVTRLNVHPVGAVMFLQKNYQLVCNSVAKVIELLSDRQMKVKEVNEVLAFKLHILACVVRACLLTSNTAAKGDVNEQQETVERLENLIKTWLKNRASDGFPENLEKFIRQCVREFKYTDCTILQQLVRSLAPVKIGDDPTAFLLVNSAINGQKMASSIVEDKVCATCGDIPDDPKKCSVCKSVWYCGQKCQKLHWSSHKKECKVLKGQYELQEREKAEDVKNEVKEVEDSGEAKVEETKLGEE